MLISIIIDFNGIFGIFRTKIKAIEGYASKGGAGYRAVGSGGHRQGGGHTSYGYACGSSRHAGHREGVVQDIEQLNVVVMEVLSVIEDMMVQDHIETLVHDMMVQDVEVAQVIVMVQEEELVVVVQNIVVQDIVVEELVILMVQDMVVEELGVDGGNQYGL